MKIKFKHQKFQEEAVKSVVDCFTGQPREEYRFTLDRGRRDDSITLKSEGIGFANRRILLDDSEILSNIRKVQQANGLKQSENLDGKYNLTIEMETGTGKSYTFIRTMFELNKQYGWCKFIVVVPSIAIREGILKSFQITEDHFMKDYGKKARYFIYNSRQLHNIESFASDSGINVMIINSQAFAAKGKDARRIYMELDDFQSRKPIDVIAGTNPILIIDEPQRVEGDRTKESLKGFKPLFTLRYSATHKQDYNKIYRLDAIDAYNGKLVKKIKVKGISVKGTTGAESYLYIEGVDISNKKAPCARIEYEKKTASGIKKVTEKFSANDDLYQRSGSLEQYKGYRISDINGLNNSVTFLNGTVLSAGDVQGDVNELNLRRIQIREALNSHFEKERFLFDMDIKVLTLFFIDEVARYRQYDKSGNEMNGEYGRIFEEEYNLVLNQHLELFEDDYIRHLKKIPVEKTHKGYFSIDKKTKRLVDPKLSSRETESADSDAYDLIMKDKERLLSFSEPTRFIFSHSALREGWDNPNVFQICTLKHSDATVTKRQEVGRGLRLCVNQSGDRIDSDIQGIDVHDVNILTVVASESYDNFARQLQGEIAQALSDRPRKVDIDFFLGRMITNERGENLKIEETVAKKIYKVFAKHEYLDDNDNLTDAYFEAAEKGSIELPPELSEHREAVIELLKSVYTEGKTALVDDDRKNTVRKLEPNSNYHKKEFQELWKKINVKTAYTVSFDSGELVKKCVDALDGNLKVPDISYMVVHGEMDAIKSKEQLKNGDAFEIKETRSGFLSSAAPSGIKYDLVGKMLDSTGLTRKTVVDILTGIRPATFALFRKNPEEFIIRSSRLINEQKATTVIERITYDITNETFDADIFTKNNLSAASLSNAVEVTKHIYDYVITDSNIERNFAKELDASMEVCVFAKLPKGFFIPTPVGTYNPDWAIVFNDNEKNLKYIYFVAETKGSMSTLQLREVEKAKIKCARKHFEKISTGDFKYDVVDSFERLLEVVR